MMSNAFQAETTFGSLSWFQHPVSYRSINISGEVELDVDVDRFSCFFSLRTTCAALQFLLYAQQTKPICSTFCALFVHPYMYLSLPFTSPVMATQELYTESEKRQREALDALDTTGGLSVAKQTQMFEVSGYRFCLRAVIISCSNRTCRNARLCVVHLRAVLSRQFTILFSLPTAHFCFARLPFPCCTCCAVGRYALPHGTYVIAVCL